MYTRRVCLERRPVELYTDQPTIKGTLLPAGPAACQAPNSSAVQPRIAAS
jgi:hypothetical protein